MKGMVFDVREFAVHDGPGLRTAVFFKGCPLRCVWCHNPEGWSSEVQLMVREKSCRHCGLCRSGCDHPDCRPLGRCLHVCPDGLPRATGEEISSDLLAARISRNGSLLSTCGGVTFTGGEPLMQAEFLHEVLDRIPGIPAAVETSGHASPEVFARAIARMELVLLDLKLADDSAHRRFTGASNAPVLRNLEILRKSGIPCVVRTPLIPGITDTDENLTAIRGIVDGLPHELLPYNELAGAKYPMLGMAFAYEESTYREGRR